MPHDTFENRHIGPRSNDIEEMLKVIGVSDMDELIDQIVPSNIRLKEPLRLQKGLSERKYYRLILSLAAKNKVFNTYIGMGYYDTITPCCNFAKCAWKIRCGTRHILLTRQRFHKAGWKHC